MSTSIGRSPLEFARDECQS